MRTQFSTKQLIEQWLSEQDINENSRKTYRRCFDAFQRFIVDNNIRMKKIDTSHIIQYKKYLIETKSTKTANLYLTIVKRFFKWTELHKIHNNVCFGVKNPKQQKTFSRMPLQPDEVTRLFDAMPKDTIFHLRNFAIVQLMVRSGLRAVEVCRLDVEDVFQMEGKHVMRVMGKGLSDKRQILPISPKALAAIHDYLLQRLEFKDNDPLFARHHRNKHTQRLTPNYISRIIKGYLSSIGLEGKMYTGHSLRHSTAYNLLKQGASLFDVMQQLRHSNPATTQLYLRQLEKERQIINPTSAIIDTIF